MYTKSVNMTTRSRRKDPATSVRKVLDTTPEVVEASEVNELASLVQEVELERRQSAAKASKGSKGSRAGKTTAAIEKGKAHAEEEPVAIPEEVQERINTLKEASVALEEAPNRLELPKNLFPDFTPALESKRRVNESDINQVRELLAKKSKLLAGTEEQRNRQIGLAKAYYAEHGPETVVVDDYNTALDIIMESAASFKVETPEGYEPKQVVYFSLGEDGGLTLSRPTLGENNNKRPMYPDYCRHNNLSYVLTQTARLEEVMDNGTPVLGQPVEISKIPLMLGSKYCWLDISKVNRSDRPRFNESANEVLGYFIIDGKSRALTGQEKLSIDLSILIDKGAKRGSLFECTMLCMTPTKALSHHIIFEQAEEKKSDQFAVYAHVQSLTPVKAANALELLRAIKIVEQGRYEGTPAQDASHILLKQALDTHIEELCKGASDPMLIEQFRAYLDTTRAKATNIQNDAEFIEEFSRMHSLPLKKKPAIPKPVITEKKRKTKVTLRTLKEAKKPVEKPPEKKEEEAPDYQGVWRYIMDRLFPQITIDTYEQLFRSRRPDLVQRIDWYNTNPREGLTQEEIDQFEADANIALEELGNLAAVAMQSAKEYLLLYNVFRLFLYRLSPATETDDRDHFGIKRVELSGSLIANLYLKQMQSAKRSIEASFIEAITRGTRVTLAELVRRFFDTGTASSRAAGSKKKVQNITAAFHSSFTSDNWGSSAKYSTTKGVSHLLNTETNAAMISGIRQVTSKGDQAKRTEAPHRYHSSQAFFMCTFQSSDDQQCLADDTAVLSTLESPSKPISAFQEGDRAVNVDIVTGQHSTSAIYNHFVRDMNPTESLYDVTTINGKKIRVTNDHPFITERGRVLCDQLTNEDRIPILPHVEYASPTIERSLVLNKEMFISNVVKTGALESRTLLHADQLTQRVFLPLHSDSPYISTLARIYGFMLCDGTVTLVNIPTNNNRASILAANSGVIFGLESDALAFERDVQSMGFAPVQPHYTESTATESGTGRQIGYHGWRISRHNAFASLLIALGINPGRKTQVPTAPVPDWIMNGSQLVKREFIAGLFGGDGTKIAWSGIKAACLHTASVTQQRREDIAHTLIAFYTQVRQLLLEFDIETREITTIISKHDPTQQAIALAVGGSKENVIQFMEKIGYRYDTRKRRGSEDTVEFMRYCVYSKELEWQFTLKLQKEKEQGATLAKLAQKYGISLGRVRVVLARNGPDAIKTPRGGLTLEQWSEKVKRIEDIILVPVTIERLSVRQRVSCFTTHSDLHTMVTKDGICLLQCGIRKYLAITAEVSREYDATTLIRGIYQRAAQKGIVVYAPEKWRDTTNLPIRHWPLFVNGIPLGYAPESILELVREWRREAVGMKEDMGLATISSYVKRRNVPGLSQRELHVSSTPNRMVRPLHIITTFDKSRPLSYNNQALLIDIESERLTQLARVNNPNAKPVDLWQKPWHELVWKYHVIEFLDKREEEQDTQVVAHFPWELSNGKGTTYTHCEINPMFLVGYNAGSMPFIEHQQGTRTAYGSNQLNHGVHSVAQLRYDTTAKILHHPQRPITTTLTYKAARFYDMPTGFNAMVAIISAKSNIEDAIVMNRRSIDRGMFMSTTFTTIRVPNVAGDYDAPQIPDKNVIAKPRIEAHLGTRFKTMGVPTVVSGSYEHLKQAYPTPKQLAHAKEVEEKTGVKVKLPSAHTAGIAPVGTKVQHEDIVVTKVRPEARGTIEFQQAVKHDRSGYVESNRMMEGKNGGLETKMRIAFPNMPEVGNKFASSESQKGLLGELRDAVDMPYTANGEIPDLLMNPHGFPSRQTLSYVMSAMFGRAVLSPPAVSTVYGSHLRGSQPYNKLYRLEEIRECFVRPNLTTMRMQEQNNEELARVRNAYARKKENEGRFVKTVVDTDKLLSFPLTYLASNKQKLVAEEAKKELAKLLQTTKKEKYETLGTIPTMRLELLKRIFSAEIVQLVKPFQDDPEEERSIQDIATDELFNQERAVLDMFYTEKHFQFYGELPPITHDHYKTEMYRTILQLHREGNPNMQDFVTVQPDYGAMDKVPLSELYTTGNETVRALITEIRSTTSLKKSDEEEVGDEETDEVSDTQGQIEKLFHSYRQSPDYVEEMTAEGVMAKKVPLSFIRVNNEALYRRLIGRYAKMYVMLIDIVELKDKSEIATFRLEKLRLERQRTETFKEQAQNATAFNKQVDADDVEEYLTSIGWKDGGEDIMYNGITGERLRCRIFRGPVYYHAQTQMAADKIQARGNAGAISVTTHRPAAGKKAGGGGKNEEMATFGAIAYGATSIIHGRLNEESVRMRIRQCANCNKQAVASVDEGTCAFCLAQGTMVEVPLPFPTVKTKAYLMTMGIDMSFAGDLAARDTRLAAEDREAIGEEVAQNFFEEKLEDVYNEQSEGEESGEEAWN